MSMKRILALLVSLALAGGALAQTPQPPEVASKSYVLVDLSSNQTRRSTPLSPITGSNARQRRRSPSRISQLEIY